MKRITRRQGLAGALAGGVAAAAARIPRARAAEVELKISHFLPAVAPAQKDLLEPWLERLKEQSGGRIDGRIFPAMQLGGKPPQLIDQVRDGIADVVWTLPSYTPGRFPVISVFELPFIMTNGPATSEAVQAYYEKYGRDEFKDIHPIIFYVHAGELVHTRETPVRTAEDFKGLKLRVPSRSSGNMVTRFGATPVSMPAPAIPEALSKGVVDGCLLPWEVSSSLKVTELTKYHTAFRGKRRLETSVFILAMNKARYESLPPDLKKVIDDNSGITFAREAGEVWEKVELPGLHAAQKAGGVIIEMPEDETAKLEVLAAPVRDEWVKELDGRGKDGKKLLSEAEALIDQYTKA